jgi:hypothetical protein
MVAGSARAALVTQYEYDEEEYFVEGAANVYGPAERRELGAGESTFDLRPLAVVKRADAPFKTRIVILRPRDNARFSGNVHLVPNHNLNATTLVEKNLLRNGDIWMGVEVNSGARFGVEERPSGGVTQLRAIDPARYGALSVAGGALEDWPDLGPGELGRAFQSLSFGRVNGELQIFVQELLRSYAQAPDILTQIAIALRRQPDRTPLHGLNVRRIFTNGASGQSTIVRVYIDSHHDAALRQYGVVPFDGYMIRVGQAPTARPEGAVVAIVISESEVVAAPHAPAPANTDTPRFRNYEIPGVGHGLTARPVRTGGHSGIGAVVPPGVQGLSNTGGGRSEYQPYDKINLPIVWAIWAAMYEWVEHGTPMPDVTPITRDASAPDNIARDSFGNALGGVRTPWVNVPDARYVAQMSELNPLEGGMAPFSEPQMRALYGDQAGYLRRVDEDLERMVRARLLLPQDVALMRRRGATEANAVGYDG